MSVLSSCLDSPVPRRTLDLEPEHQSVRVARRFVADALEQWDCGGVVDEVLVATSEVITNAVIHAQTPFTVAVERRGNGIRVEVRDGSGVEPVAEEVENSSERGRGMRIVASLVTRWGTETLPDGKAVWFEVEP
jgi:anti-sigma regulatory factor (Ser/Thr protein kinase)